MAGQSDQEGEQVPPWAPVEPGSGPGRPGDEEHREQQPPSAAPAPSGFEPPASAPPPVSGTQRPSDPPLPYAPAPPPPAAPPQPGYGQAPPPAYGATPPVYGAPPPAGYGPPPPGYAAPPYGGYGQAPPPGYGAPPYGYPQPYVARKTNGFAIASLIVAVTLSFLWGIGSILALVFGYVGKSQIDNSGDTEDGRGLAIAGIVIGWIGVVGWGLLLIAIIAAGS